MLVDDVPELQPRIEALNDEYSNCRLISRLGSSKIGHCKLEPQPQPFGERLWVPIG